jgi:hypothetical protein
MARAATRTEGRPVATDPIAFAREIRQFVVGLREWMTGPDSEPFYERLSEAQKIRFNRLSVRLGRVETRLFDVELEPLAERASAQMASIGAAITDARGRLQAQQDLAADLASLGAVIDIITDLVL